MFERWRRYLKKKKKIEFQGCNWEMFPRNVLEFFCKLEKKEKNPAQKNLKKEKGGQKKKKKKKN